MSQFREVLFVTVAIALGMALLMAYNTSAINADERARENATMFAFGVPSRRVLSLGVGEALLVGLLATVLGIAAGYALLRWMVGSALTETMPDVGMLIAIQPLTIVGAVAAGTVAVALAPLLMRRRLQRTDIPATLRVVE
jgi:putative ABC transport system permease protein